MRLLQLLYTMREAGIPVSTSEFLTLLQGLKDGLIRPCVEELRHLCRCVLVKDEAHFERFDQAFRKFLEQQAPGKPWIEELMPELLQMEEHQHATAADAIMKHVKRHGRGGGPSRSATPMVFRDYDGNLPLNSRGMQLALRRLRRFAREGNALEFDLDRTIHATAHNGGYLDIRMRPIRRNHSRLLLLMDVGGSMDEHTRKVEELFTAIRSEFSAIEFFYFHNCVYDHVWRENRRASHKTNTMDLIRRFGGKYQLLFVGDATMSPSEILLPGGSAESKNTEPGLVWIERLVQAFPRHVWLNPEPEGAWPGRQTIQVIKRTLRRGMHPLTVNGVHNAMRELAH